MAVLCTKPSCKSALGCFRDLFRVDRRCSRPCVFVAFRVFSGTGRHELNHRIHGTLGRAAKSELFWILLIILFAFQPSAFGQRSPADLVVVNANVRTMVSRDSIAEAFAVSGNRISSVGTTKHVRRLIGPSTRVLDAQGKLVVPGFNDAHVHFMGIGNSFSSIDLRDAMTPADVESRIARYIEFLPRGRWVLGGGLSATAVPGTAAIDKMSTENPVFIYLSATDTAFANSRALELAGLKESPGLVKGSVLRKIAHVVPANHTRNWQEIGEVASRYAASLGVTSVQDMHSDDNREIYRELHRRGKLKTRVYDCISLSDWKRISASTASRARGEMVRGGCLKSFSDGDRDAAPKILSNVLAADKAGLQVMIHAIGHLANEIVLDAFERATKSNPRRDRRFRIEHAYNPRREDLPRFARARVVASLQPQLFSGGSGGYYASLLKLKSPIAFGSDAAIGDLDPILGIQSAVDAGGEAISVYDAVRAYTLGSAYAEFQEKEKGTVETGKLADFVILSDDIFTIEAQKIRSARVIMTVVDGQIVYQSE